jgi:hypothetical protein
MPRKRKNLGLDFRISSPWQSPKVRKSERPKVRKSGKGLRQKLINIKNKVRHVLTAPSRFVKGLRHDLPPQAKNKLEQVGGYDVVEMWAGRTPLDSVIDRGLNLASSGRWDKKKKELGYDDVFHVYLIARLNNGRTVKIEKNAVVDITDYKPNSDEIVQVELNQPQRLDKMMANVKSKFGNEIWDYHPERSNCQDFANAFVEANHDTVDNQQQTEDFITQDKDALNESLGAGRLLTKGLTNIAGRAHHAVFGQGVCPCGHIRIRHHSQ